MSRTFLMAGGGTGGHIFPLVAVAEALREIDPSHVIVYVGTNRGLERRILDELGERLEVLDILPVKGVGFQGAVKGFARAVMTLPDARNLLRRVAPCAVLSIGGYAAGPIALAARLMKIPLAVLEPNSVVGLANQLVAPFAQRAYVAFPEVESKFRKRIVRRTGVPLRRDFVPSDYQSTAEEFRVLVLGGSQGAITLNRNVPEAVGMARRRTSMRIHVKHQCGSGREGEVLERYRAIDAAEHTEVVPFIQEVPQALAASDLVIQRAGASAVSEVCAVGRPSILIPYPYAAGQHQLHNAQAMDAAGASICVSSEAATPSRLADILCQLAGDPERRGRMAAAARSRGQPEAAQRIARDLLALVEAA